MPAGIEKKALQSRHAGNFPSLFTGLIASLLMAGCMTQPAYRTPEVRMPAAWHAPQPHAGSRQQLADWWARFDDPVLSRLIHTAEEGSPSLAQAAARIAGARATLASSQAGALPSVSGSAALSRARQAQGSGQGQGQPGSSTLTSRSAGLDASWEIDLFGKLRKGSEAAEARLEARVADWHDARVSLAAEVADNYVQFLGCRMLAEAYQAEAASQASTLRITQTAITAGLTARADGDLAAASAANANVTAIAQGIECGVLLKALVALTGESEPALGLVLDTQPPALRDPEGISVASVPGNLLRQRPDLAASERALAAAYADIGQADADRYPSLSLGGSISLSASSLASSATSWSFGPSLSVPVFDGGKRKAAVASAEASYQEALASYQNAVRSAVKEVEQALLRLDGAARRYQDAERAAQGYRRYFEAVEKNWRAGNVSLLDLEEARRSAITAESTLSTLKRDRLRYWIALYKALGGGWSTQAQSAAPASAPGAKPPASGHNIGPLSDTLASAASSNQGFAP
ncbi:efflux transporter outer membrane subunit [Polaromonas naphthalenivorans]|uniref:RND efflux system, outer membrane lipoprotein, NodT family n=1 Tax=Polaromonas naphthalenivorans (strain CJ2) TaxID=365044 RepID=A1VRJ0_POLNA|nr:efflux transporter outer membrane subunit [Polaromonas naphthalenivorans]ABM38268.1 RND efflux system, outer membrane lipoprotein, NodT family [Polaromonas naphthalenivorans CJ2]